MPARAHRSLVKPFDPYSCAAARAGGPNTGTPASRRLSARPSTSGASGPITTRPIARSRAKATTAGVIGRVERHERRDLRDAGLPGAAKSVSRSGDCASFPCQRVFAAPGAVVAGRSCPIPFHGSAAGAEPTPGDNALALSVGELSSKLKRMVEGEFGHVRLRGEISGFSAPPPAMSIWRWRTNRR